MVTSENRLRTLRVRDVMNPHVITIPANAKVSEAGEVLRRHRVSGAPVVDELGRLVGVLTAADFIPGSTDRDWTCDCVQEIVQDYPGGPYHVEQHDVQIVRNVMSDAVQTVEADSPLLNAARCLCLEHIHRVIVVDREVRPIGILTSLDIVAAVVNAVEESGD